MAIDDASSDGSQDPAPSAPTELARKAEALSGAMIQLLRRLDGVDPEVKSRLEALRLVFEEHARRARDVASGAAARRARPMAQAWIRARSQGGKENWRSAFAELAQAALGESRPLWYAAGALAALSPDWAEVGREEAKALVGPLEQEMGLGAPGYGWAWLPADAPALREHWERARSVAASP